MLPGLTVGEAQDLGPWLIKVRLLLPMRDESIDTVFHSRAEHIPAEQPPERVQATEQVEDESVDSSRAEAEDPGEEMVVRRNMTTDWFLPSKRPTMQQRAPPPPAP